MTSEQSSEHPVPGQRVVGQSSTEGVWTRPVWRAAAERVLGVDHRRRTLMLALGTAGAAGVALAFGLWLGGGLRDAQLGGLVQAGPVTALGLPISRLTVDVSAVGTVGMLITCILLPRAGGELSDAARRCLRSAAWLALAWAAATAAMLLFFWSDVTGQAIMRLPFSEVLNTTTSPFPEAVTFLFSAILAGIIAAGAGVTQTIRGAWVLLALTAYNLLPLTSLGHGRHSSISRVSVTMHIIAMALWVGGLLGLLIHARWSSPLLAVAVPRFSRLALACYITVGASGLTTAWISLGAAPEVWRSRYGLLVLYKVTALVTLGTFGWWHRRRTVRAIRAAADPSEGPGARHAFLRLAAAEVVVMAATVALAVALSRAPTPPPASPTNYNTHAPRPPCRPGSIRLPCHDRGNDLSDDRMSSGAALVTSP